MLKRALLCNKSCHQHFICSRFESYLSKVGGGAEWQKNSAQELHFALTPEVPHFSGLDSDSFDAV